MVTFLHAYRFTASWRMPIRVSIAKSGRDDEGKSRQRKVHMTCIQHMQSSSSLQQLETERRIKPRARLGCDLVIYSSEAVLLLRQVDGNAIRDHWQRLPIPLLRHLDEELHKRGYPTSRGRADARQRADLPPEEGAV